MAPSATIRGGSANKACRELVCAAEQLLALLELSALQLQRWVGLQEARDACAALESHARAAVALARAAGLAGCLAGATRALFASGLSSLARACAPRRANKPSLLGALGGLFGRARAASLVLLAVGGGRSPSTTGAAAAAWASVSASLCYCRAAACFLLGWVLCFALLVTALRSLSHARQLQLQPPSASVSSAGRGLGVGVFAPLQLLLLRPVAAGDPHQQHACEAAAAAAYSTNSSCPAGSSMPSCGEHPHHGHRTCDIGCSPCASAPRASCSGRGIAAAPSHQQHGRALGGPSALRPGPTSSPAPRAQQQQQQQQWQQQQQQQQRQLQQRQQRQQQQQEQQQEQQRRQQQQHCCDPGGRGGLSLPSTALHVVALSLGGVGALSAPATWLLGGSLTAWLAGQLAWACLLAAHLCHAAWPAAMTGGGASWCGASAGARSSGGAAGKAGGCVARVLAGAPVPAAAAQLACMLLLPFLLGALPFAGSALRAAATLARLLAVAAAVTVGGLAALHYLKLLRGGRLEVRR
ncbi:hypothetical protein FOA52_006725 [Chlamydomonas sp. UWO 241]|nr:hypothetical protein FOA52_006725 [Chlamydomonas sp. UWO 241]